MEIIAHRGAALDAPENSLEAFERAIEQRAHRLELDVHLSADGVAVVSHDPTTARCTDRDLTIATTSLEALREARLPNGEALPTFDELCAKVRARIALDVEIKATDPRVVAAVLESLRRFELLDGALITSFETSVLAEARRLGYRGRLGLLAGSRSWNPRQRLFELWPLARAARFGADAIALHHRLTLPVHRAATSAQNMRLYVWMTLDDELAPPEARALAYRRAVNLRPDGIIAARISELREIVSGARS